MGFRLAPKSMTLDDLGHIKFEFLKFGKYSLDGADVCSNLRLIRLISRYFRVSIRKTSITNNNEILFSVNKLTK